MYIKIAIAEYTLIFFILVGVAVVLKVILGVLGISKTVKKAAVEWMPLRLYILL